jgi:hypothetical protein
VPKHPPPGRSGAEGEKMTTKKSVSLTLSVPSDLIERIDQFIEGGNYLGLRTREEVALHFMNQGSEGEDGFPQTAPLRG